MTTQPTNNTNPATSPFGLPLDYAKSLYGHDIEEIFHHLPALVAKCQELAKTEHGKSFTKMRLPQFVLGSNEMEGTMSRGATDNQLFTKFHEWMDSDKFSLLQGGNNIQWNDYEDKYHQQCKVHLCAVKMMITMAESGEPLSPQKLAECHWMLKHRTVTSSGDPVKTGFRDFNEAVFTGTFYVPKKNVDHFLNMQDLLEKRENEFGTTNPIEWACKLALEILSSHPFPNGNGQMAQLCFTYALARHGIPCAVVLSNWDDKAREHFIRALQEAQGQKGPAKYDKMHSMAISGLYATLNNMVKFCEFGSLDGGDEENENALNGAPGE